MEKRDKCNPAELQACVLLTNGRVESQPFTNNLQNSEATGNILRRKYKMRPLDLEGSWEIYWLINDTTGRMLTTLIIYSVQDYRFSRHFHPTKGLYLPR